MASLVLKRERDLADKAKRAKWERQHDMEES
jgi:hypothetical protein